MPDRRRPEPKTRKTLPKTLPGTVQVQWTRCGKPTCRCARGEPHGPYFYRFFREHGRLRKTYVPRPAVSDTMARCAARQEERRLLRLSFGNWREIARRLREVEGLR
jgi:hypothetical protein